MDSAKHFDILADHYDKLRPVYIPLMNKLAEVLEVKDGDIVVDYGCGPGHDLEYLASKYKIESIGIDKSAEMCRIASKNTGINKIINGDNQSFVQNLSFDKIYFKFVMHHIPQPFRFIDDIIGCQKTGGSFAVVTMLPANIESYIVLKYFPVFRPLLGKRAQEQFEVIEHIKQKSSLKIDVLELDINEEIIDETLIEKIQRNYVSFISTLSEEEKNEGIEKIKIDINNNGKNKHFTKGVICYGSKR
jgi:trans-aconitate methyltransferase